MTFLIEDFYLLISFFFSIFDIDFIKWSFLKKSHHFFIFKRSILLIIHSFFYLLTMATAKVLLQVFTIVSMYMWTGYLNWPQDMDEPVDLYLYKETDGSTVTYTLETKDNATLPTSIDNTHTEFKGFDVTDVVEYLKQNEGVTIPSMVGFDIDAPLEVLDEEDRLYRAHRAEMTVIEEPGLFGMIYTYLSFGKDNTIPSHPQATTPAVNLLPFTVEIPHVPYVAPPQAHVLLRNNAKLQRVEKIVA